jgi:quercetin dioxygenase-like cupin family protein
MEANERAAINVAPEEGKMLWVVGELLTLKMVESDTEGAFALIEEVTPPQGGPPPHTHTREDETFYVLEGELEFVVGGRALLATAGSVVHGPRGIPHAFRNVGTISSSRMAVFITPAGLEGIVETITLSTGAEIPFRTIRPEDAPALQRALGRCSERTIYLRFFGSLEELSDEKARYFASTDDIDHFAFVALDPEDPNEIIVVVRYARKPGDE